MDLYPNSQMYKVFITTLQQKSIMSIGIKTIFLQGLVRRHEDIPRIGFVALFGVRDT